MGKYLFIRLIHMLLTLVAMVVLMFFVFRLMPGDPTATVISDALYPKAQAAMMKQFGLDKPLLEQFVIYLKNYAQFDFGISFRTNRSVAELIEGRLMNTIMLILPSMIAAYGMGMVFGAMLAWWPRRQG